MPATLYKSRLAHLNISVSICYYLRKLLNQYLFRFGKRIQIPVFSPGADLPLVDAEMTIGWLTAQTRKSHKYNIGFTLVETLVAIALLLAVLVGPITLIARSLFSASFSRNNLIANNLAQEGIELIRAVRDNNVLCIARGGTVTWDDNPNGPPPKLLGRYELDPTQDINLICGSNTISTPRPLRRNTQATCNTPILVDGNGVYNYVAGAESIFTRCVRVCSPPNAAPCSAAADTDIPNNDQLEIISTVSWIERGAPKSITLRSRLYRWQ